MRVNTLTDTYKEYSEDIFGRSEHCFWILDGALPLTKASYTNGISDVVWMVNWWNNYLSNNIEQLDESIVSILEKGIKLLNDDFSKFADINTLSKLDRACATIAIIRINENIVESYILGDSEINIRIKDGKIKTIIDENVKNLDKEVINMIFNNPERMNNITFNGYTDEELKKLRDMRMKMNTKEGYYILEHELEAIKHGVYREMELSKVMDILMMSDGYSAIYNKYMQLELNELMDNCKRNGLEDILSSIRRVEDDDANFTKYRRLRLHDDATAIYINMDS